MGVFWGADFVGLEQENAEIISGAGRSAAPSGYRIRLARLAYSASTRVEFLVLLRLVGRNAAGMAIPFQPHLLLPACVVFIF